MTAAGWITMALVCGYVWGGVILLVTIAMRKERFKAEVPDRPWEP
ncbi:MAG TPA: hypothetical protein VIE68_08130 [Gemmatimonadota bacterium]|jgi:hypothetical protein